jgi:hypothetical protein
MGLFDFLRSKDEKAIPEPGTPEFQAAVEGSALPDSQSVEMGETGWTSADSKTTVSTSGGGDDPAEAAREALAKLGIDPSKADIEVEQTSQTLDLRGTGAREKIVELLRQHGIDPDKKGQQIDAGGVPGLQQAILGALGEAGVQIPEAGGFTGGVSPPEADPIAQIEHLAKKRDAGEITEAEFEAQKRTLLGP